MSTTAPVTTAPVKDPDFTLGDRMRKRRRELGLDQEDVAVAVKVSRPLVSKWERDKSLPNVEQAWALARVLNCSFGWLCGVPARSRCSSALTLVDGGVADDAPVQRELHFGGTDLRAVQD